MDKETTIMNGLPCRYKFSDIPRITGNFANRLFVAIGCRNESVQRTQSAAIGFPCELIA
jgi:hypothetical protein